MAGNNWKAENATTNFADQSDEIMALLSFYEGTHTLTVLEEGCLETGATARLQFSVPIKTSSLDKLTADIWLPADNVDEGKLADEAATSSQTATARDVTREGK